MTPTPRAGMVFYEWLLARDHLLDLPRLQGICLQLKPEIINPYRLAHAIEWLARNRLIDVAHGTRSLHRGHYIIRVRSTGRVYRTVNCALEPPTT